MAKPLNYPYQDFLNRIDNIALRWGWDTINNGVWMARSWNSHFRIHVTRHLWESKCSDQQRANAFAILGGTRIEKLKADIFDPKFVSCQRFLDSTTVRSFHPSLQPSIEQLCTMGFVIRRPTYVEKNSWLREQTVSLLLGNVDRYRRLKLSFNVEEDTQAVCGSQCSQSRYRPTKASRRLIATLEIPPSRWFLQVGNGS